MLRIKKKKMNTSTYKEYWKKITAYFSNDLSSIEKMNIDHWADQVDNKELLSDVNTKIEMIENAKYMFSDETNLAWNKLSQRIKQDKNPFAGFIMTNKIVLSIAASVILFLSIGLVFLLQKNSQMMKLQTAYNQSEVVLSDGSIVHLNGNSELEYPSKFESKNRIVKLKGEAFFNVQSDKNHPFIIEAENARIHVIGTAFNVKTFSDTKNVEVLVSEGKVRLQNSQNPKQQIDLIKGDFAELASNNLKTKKISDINYLSWQTKILSFNNTPLQEVITVLNRTYAVKIVLESEEIGKFALTSTYNQMKVNALLDAICLTFNLNQKEENDSIIIY
jgi:ferric-dicitrate binding protein FerR (iron transport regulator)